MILRLSVYVSFLLLFSVFTAGATGTCWVSEFPGGLPVNFVSTHDLNNHKSYWMNYNGTTSRLTMKIKLTGGSPEKIQIQKLETNIAGLMWVPFSLPEDHVVHGPAKLIVRDDTGKCTHNFNVGTIRRFDLSGITKIPDFTMVCGVANVSGINTVSHVRAGLYVQHSFVSDLQLTLWSPGNMVNVPLSMNNGGGGDDYGRGFYEYYGNFGITVFDDTASTPITAASAPFQGMYAPQGSLSALNGLTGNQANGSWQLCVNDLVAGDEGYYLGGFIEITDQF